jgi:tetratricopeptide (TPR) repeat protein
MFTLRSFPIALLAVLVRLGCSCDLAAAQERTDFPAEARERYEKGVELRGKGQLDEAIRAFDEAIKLGMQDFARVHLNRAGSNLDLQQYDKAIAQYTEFIEQFGLEKSCRL